MRGLGAGELLIALSRATRIHLATEPVDFRKAIDGLSGVVRNVLRDNPASGHLFVFHSRDRRALKLLWWDEGGFCLLHKRLVQGRFRLPAFVPEAARVAMTGAELAALLEGIDLAKAVRLPRWNPP